MSESFKKLVGQAREDWGTRASRGVDWDTVDKALFERIDRERTLAFARPPPKPSGPWGVAAAVALAAAVVVAVAVGKGHERPTADVAAGRDVESESAGGVTAIEGAGRATINRVLTSQGASLHVGDVIESGDAQVTIERPGKLTMILERNSRATITHAHGALVLALDHGAVEATVVPVASGEAFAVDVDRTRIAVHGTHLRVARVGQNVTVDLSEGVVSIGDAPRVGNVVGTVLVAPAHAEFSAGVLSTLTETHEAAAQRSPAELVAAETPKPPAGAAPAPSKAEPSAPHPASPVTRPEAHPVSSAPSALPSEADTVAAVSSAVRACMADQTPAENVTVQVKTTLYLTLQDDGSVRSARFEPPVAPDVNECATPAIYKARFKHGGTANVDLAYVTSLASPMPK